MRQDVQDILQRALLEATLSPPSDDARITVSVGVLERVVDLSRRAVVPVSDFTGSATISGSGERLRVARKAAGLSARVLGDAVGLRESAVRNQENGINGIRPEVAAKYAEVLGVDASWLLFGGENGVVSSESPPPDELERLRVWLRGQMGIHSMSQTELARKLNLDASAVNRMANGARKISAEELIKLERIFAEAAAEMPAARRATT